MKKPFYLLFLVSFLSFKAVFSQSIKGTVIDNISKENISYATVILKDLQGKFLVGATTNDNGSYVLKQAIGSYNLEVSFIGYKKFKKRVTLNKKSTVINIALEKSSANLDEVVITAETSTIKQLIDKKVVTVGKDLLSTGGSAATVLDQLSEVQADENGAISLRGSSNVNVLVNGKPSPLSTTELLQQINASDINKIEVITSPSAKYQANGLTGIINIITKKKVKKGLAAQTSIGINTLGAYHGNGNITYGISKLNYRLGASYKKFTFKREGSQERVGDQPFSNINDFAFIGGVYNFNTGVDWFPDEFNELSLDLKYADNGHSLESNSKITQNNLLTAQNSFAYHSHKTASISSNYRHFFENKKNFIEIDGQFSNNTNLLSSDFTPNLQVKDNATKSHVLISSLAVDYFAIINDKFILEAGGLWNQKNLGNTLSTLETNTAPTSETFTNVQATYALYSLLKYTNKKLALQVGIRGEVFNRDANLQTQSTTVKNSFANLFPSFHLSYEVNENQTAIFGYNRRTSRPSLRQVNPTVLQINEFNIRTGNPELQPEFSNNINVSYRIKKGIFSFSPTISYRRKEGAIISSNLLNSNGVNELKPINAGNSNAFGLELGIAAKFNKWLKSTLDFGGNYESFEENQIGFPRSYSRNYNIVLRNDFKLSKKTNVSLSWRYDGNKEAYFMSRRFNQNVTIAFSHKILNNQGTISLRATDIFNTRNYISTSEGVGFSLQANNKPLSRVLHFSFSYRFGSGRRKRKKKERTYDSGVLD